MLYFFFLMIRRPPRSTLFPTRRSSDLTSISLTPDSAKVGTFGNNCDRFSPVSASATSRFDSTYGSVDAMEPNIIRSEEHTSELQSRRDLVCRLLLEKKKRNSN